MIAKSVDMTPSEEQREIRRPAIVDASLTMPQKTPVTGMGLNELSRRVGLARSKVLRYLYPATRYCSNYWSALRTWLEQVYGELSGRVNPHLSAATRWQPSWPGLWRTTACCAIL